MSSKGKYIGLNQRIPFEVLDGAVQEYLETQEVNKAVILQNLAEHTSGANRASKAAQYVAQILTRQKSILDQFRKTANGKDYFSIRVEERKALCLCLISLTYPIAYDLLVALAQGFKVQDQINKKFISEKVMSIYGSNRTVDIALDALLPMLIELETIHRVKVSIYSLGPPKLIRSKFIAELIIHTDIKLSGSKSILVDDLLFRPWYSYFVLSGRSTETFNLLVKRKEGAVGKGYLTI